MSNAEAWGAHYHYIYYDFATDSMQAVPVDIRSGPAGYERAGAQCIDYPPAPTMETMVASAAKQLARDLTARDVGSAISALHGQRSSNGLPNRYEVMP